MNVKPHLALALTLLLALGAIARAETQPTLNVAVYDFTDTDKNGSYGSKVTTLLTANLSTETNIVLLERADLNKALNEQAIGVSGMVNSDEAAKIGQITGVKVLVTGQVLRTSETHLVIVANIVGTETGRLFAEKVEGVTTNFSDMTSALSRRIAKNIRDHYSSFVHDVQSHEDYLARIVKNVKGTNRPTVTLTFHFPKNERATCVTADSEMGIILQKAGFTVVDAQSDRKPDIEISGLVQSDTGPKRGGLFSCRSVVEAKVQERRSGKILAVDRQMGDAVDIGKMTAARDSIVQAVDALAERLLPVLAQETP